MLDRTLAILGDLIRFPTISTDSNLQMIDYLSKHLAGLGARTLVTADASGTKANLFATLGPDEPGGIVLSGHTDVVPVADQDWTTDPFEMVERDGLFFGRGSCDLVNDRQRRGGIDRSNALRTPAVGTLLAAF